MSSLDQAIVDATPLSARDRHMYRGGIWLAIAAETMVFVTVFSTRFLLAGTERLVDPGDPLAVLISMMLVASLVPAWLAKRRIVAGDSAAMARYLAVTSVVGVVVLVVMVADWATLSFSPSSRFGENYIISTGYHALHILIGVIWLGAAAVAGRRHVYTRANHWTVEGGIVFWSFVVVMWIALYLVFFVA